MNPLVTLIASARLLQLYVAIVHYIRHHGRFLELWEVLLHTGSIVRCASVTLTWTFWDESLSEHCSFLCTLSSPFMNSYLMSWASLHAKTLSIQQAFLQSIWWSGKHCCLIWGSILPCMLSAQWPRHVPSSTYICYVLGTRNTWRRSYSLVEEKRSIQTYAPISIICDYQLQDSYTAFIS